jgi:2-polyprenyl-3-methyl-5-hydroxy-6-metoxy-1,4-benzoquinol methylase
MPDRYRIRSGYRARRDPLYFDDDLRGVTWQPDVYADAGRIAATLGARRIIDFGSGDGNKLAALRPEFEIIGIDFGANVARSIERHPSGSWREHDFDKADTPIPVSSEELVDSVLVCSDVIEHLRSPDTLLRTLRGALEQASVLVLSTPERELWHGVRSLDVPRNPHHVREWSIRELEQLMRASGFDWLSMGLTRSNDRTDDPYTIEVVATRDGATLASVVDALIDRPIPKARSKWKARIIRAARVLRYG